MLTVLSKTFAGAFIDKSPFSSYYLCSYESTISRLSGGKQFFSGRQQLGMHQLRNHFATMLFEATWTI